MPKGCPRTDESLVRRDSVELFVAGVWQVPSTVGPPDTKSRYLFSFQALDEAIDIHKHVAYHNRHGAYNAGKASAWLKDRSGVTDAELAVLKVLWARKALTAKAITEAIYPDGAESEFAAVHSFLQRLERKGLVARDRSSFVHVFSPTASQADILGQELKTLAARLGGGSIAPLIMQLIEEKRLSKKEAAEIRKLLEKYSK